MKNAFLIILLPLLALAFAQPALARTKPKPSQPARAHHAVKTKTMAKAKAGAAGRVKGEAKTKTGPLGQIDQTLIAKVFDEICMNEIQEPQFVMRQAILETGWLRSPYLMRRNNLFGFKKVKYLNFSNWQDSVAYYKGWQIKNPQLAGENYEQFLVRIKYGSPSYLSALKTIQWNKSCSVRLQDQKQETRLEN